ncbi:MAG TPA: glycosyltransferase family 39 protein [Burkholderiaceae bacterium]|nr:glycosyltransferase family 39 protein [Burkholderiaceae bacterium]
MRNATAVAVIAILVGLRLVFVGQPAVWIDEAFSLYHARHSLASLWGTGWQLESSPPLYYTLLWLWTHGFGTAEWAARLLSALMACGAAWFVFRAADAIAGRTAALVAAALFACHPLVFHYSLEIRPYPLQMLLVAVAVDALARALQQVGIDGGASPAAARRFGLRAVLACIALGYTHATAPAFLVAASAAVACHGLLWANRPAFWRGWTSANVAVLAGIAPQIWVTLTVLSSNGARMNWIPSPTDPSWLAYLTSSLAAGVYGAGSSVALPLFGAAVLIGSAWHCARQPIAATVAVLLPAFGFAALFVASLLQPVMLPRTLVWLLVPVCVLIGCAIGRWSWRHRSGWLLAIPLCIAFGQSTVENLRDRATERWWPGVIREQAAHGQPQDQVVAVDPEMLCVYDYYGSAAFAPGARWVLRHDPDRHPQRIDLGCNRTAQIDAAAIAQRLAAGAGVWLITRDTREREVVDAVLRSLPATHRVTRVIERDGQRVAVRIAIRQQALADE